MINNTTAKSVYTITAGVTEYPVGFLFQYNPDNTPQIKVYIKTHPESPLVYGTNYTISQDELNVELISGFNVGDTLVILRAIPMVQLSDYVIGRIDPEQIESDFDEAVMRDQQLQAEIDLLEAMPVDHETRIQAIEAVIPSEATPSNQLADKQYVQNGLDTKVDANTGITGGTHTKITYDSKGLVTGGSDIDTSDLTDLDVATVQDGDFLRYNGVTGKWENAQSSASVGFSGITGSPYDNTALGKELNIKTNCITNIPQDIKLELNAGVLTLKAGSKVYVPNGTGVFTEVTINNDVTKTDWGASDSGTRFLCLNINGSYLYGFENGLSGTSTSSENGMYYRTGENYIYPNNNSSGTKQSFPICKLTLNNGIVTAIDQVFNGFGYIGSTVFALPGVSGLIPNGRNADGTLNNTPFTVANVLTYTGNDPNIDTICLSATALSVYKGAYSKPVSGKVTYQEDENYNYASLDILNRAFVGMCLSDGTKITVCNPKQVFQAVDYSDINQLLNLMYPVGSIYIGTQSTCPMAALISGSTWTQIQGRYLLASGTLAGTSESYSATNTVASGLPDFEGVIQGADLGAVSGMATDDGNSSQQWFYGNNVSVRSKVKLKGSVSNSTYGQSGAVRAPAYVINVWRRTA